MTPEQFRDLALSLPGAEASSHHDQPDVRVGGRIFATHGGRHEGRAVLKLTPEQQEMLRAAEPALFEPVRGAWGAKGWTLLDLAGVDAATARSVLWTAWRNVAPARLQRLHPPA